MEKKRARFDLNGARVWVMARDLGCPASIRVIATQKQFDRYWPIFVESMGLYPVVGMNCKWNQAAVGQQMDRLGFDPDSKQIGASTGEHKRYKVRISLASSFQLTLFSF